MTVHPPKTVDTRAVDVVEVKNGQSKRTSASEMQRELGKITQHVSSGLGKAVDRPNKDVLNAYAEVLKAIAEVEKALPTSRTISFRLTRHEVGVLFTYGTGGLLLLLALTFMLPRVDWKAENLLTVLMYWSTIVAVLLGADALPKIFGKSE